MDIKLTDLLARKPNAMDEIFAHIANGGTLIDLATLWGVPYHDLYTWAKSGEREETYNLAISARAEWMIQRILRELKFLSTVDIRQAYDAAGCLLPIREIPEEVARVITSIETDEILESTPPRAKLGETRKVRFSDKIKSLELLGKQLGMFITNHNVRLEKSLEDLVAESNNSNLTDPPKR